MVFQISLAGIEIEVHSLHKMVYQICSDYLLKQMDDKPPDLVVSTCDDDAIKEWNREKKGYRLVIGEQYYEVLAVLRKICEKAPEFDVLMMHGAVVSYNGMGYMFTAPSGTGKSTRANLWLQAYEGSSIVNGDKPFIRVTNHGVIAYGSPWRGKEGWGTNTSVPLRAIFFLRRSLDGKTKINEMEFSDAFYALLNQIYIPEDQENKLRAFETIKRFRDKVRFYDFQCPPTIEAIRIAYETVQRREHESLF